MKTYSFMQDPTWKQYHVLQAEEQLDRLPESDRDAAATLIDQPGVPPQSAIPILTNLANMPRRERQSIFRLHASDDDRERSLALTRAAGTPPMPDSRRANIDRAVRELREAIKHFPGDPMTPRLEEITTDLRAVAREIRHSTKERAEQ